MTSDRLIKQLDELTSRHRRDAEQRNFDHVRTIAHDLGLIPVNPPTVIVGGTNGKSSTVFLIEQLLLKQGVSVGATASPHLLRFNERIRIDGCEIDDEPLSHALSWILEVTQDVPLTYFDLTTLASLHVFRQPELDYLILEVGLGGRLDCANIIDSQVAVITNVALDHTELLGSTRDLIATEKAGILREGSTFVYGHDDMPETLREAATSLRCQIDQPNRHREINGSKDSTNASAADVLGSNLAIAESVVNAIAERPTASQLAEVANLQLDGRQELLRTPGGHWILDVAHNPAAIRHVCSELNKEFPLYEKQCIFGCFASKDLNGMLSELSQTMRRILLVPTQGSRGRTSYDDTLSTRYEKLQIVSDLHAAIDMAINPYGNNFITLICGSFDVVSRARTYLDKRTR